MNSTTSRFIGARSYEEKDQAIFFGRNSEADDLFQLVNINTFTLLYGKSGLGKTSVLQAGLFPILRQKKFLPIYVRPNYREADSDFVRDTERIILKSFQENKTDYLLPASKQTLWEYLHVLAEKRGELDLIPVLVFDQFEEIFTLGSTDKSSELRYNTKAFIELLSDLIENSPPEMIEEGKRIDLQYKYGSKNPPVKVLFSFREEYLGDFYSLSSYIPSIAYSNLQYKLTPLTYSKGYEIIEKAGNGLFEEKAIEETLRVVSESEKIEIAQKRDIDSFLLSIFCENQIAKAAFTNKQKIQASDIRKVQIDKIVKEAYDKVVKRLLLNPSEVRFLEERMLSPEGFRWPVYLDLALKFDNSMVREEKIRALEEGKIIKRYSIDGKRVIEIIHDRYALAIKSDRDFRLKAEQNRLQLLADQEDLRQQKIAQDLQIAENRATLAQTEITSAKEKLVLQKRTNRWLLTAAVFLLLLGIIAGYYYIDAKNQENFAISKASALSNEQKKAGKLYKALKAQKAELVKSQDSLKLNFYMVKTINNQLSKAKSNTEKTNQLLQIRYMQVQFQRNLAERNEKLANTEKIKANALFDSVARLNRQYETSANVGQLLATARILKNSDPATAYRSAQLAQKLDPKNIQVGNFLDTIRKGSRYFEMGTVDGYFATFAPDGRSFLTIRKDGLATLYGIPNFIPLKIFHADKILDARFSNDSKRILMTTQESSILFDVDANSEIKVTPPASILSSIFFSNYTDRFATVSKSQVNIWDNNGKLIRTIVLKDDFIYAAATDENNLYLTAEFGASIYNLNSGKLEGQLRPLENNINGVPYFIIPKSNKFLAYYRGSLNVSASNTDKSYQIKLNDYGAAYNQVSATLFSRNGEKLLITLSGVADQRLQQQQQQQQQLFTSNKNQYREPETYFVDLPNKQARKYFKNILNAQEGALSPDGSLLVLQTYSSFYNEVLDNSNQLKIGDIYYTADARTREISADNKMILMAFGNSVTKVYTFGNVVELDQKGLLQKIPDTEVFKNAGIKK